jgi:hypothetical protein
LRRRQGGCDLHRHLHAPAVAQEVQIDNFAGLDVAHAIVKIHEVGYARTIDADYQVVRLTERNGFDDRGPPLPPAETPSRPDASIRWGVRAPTRCFTHCSAGMQACSLSDG